MQAPRPFFAAAYEDAMFNDQPIYQDEPVPKLRSYEDENDGALSSRWRDPTLLAPWEDEPTGDDRPLLPPPLKISQPAHRQMMEYLLARRPEAAGLLLGPADDDLLVTHFVPDKTGHGTSASFELDAAELNKVLKRVKPAGLNCKGIAHTHPAGVPCPSQGDLNYLRRVFGLAKNSAAVQFFMPIICGGRVYGYVYAQECVQRAEIILV
jgi:proteasome lid subunit RPN8/RPN11